MNCKRVKLSISVLFSQTDCQNLVRMIKKKGEKECMGKEWIKCCKCNSVSVSIISVNMITMAWKFDVSFIRYPWKANIPIWSNTRCSHISFFILASRLTLFAPILHTWPKKSNVCYSKSFYGHFEHFQTIYLFIFFKSIVYLSVVKSFC